MTSFGAEVLHVVGEWMKEPLDTKHVVAAPGSLLYVGGMPGSDAPSAHASVSKQVLQCAEGFILWWVFDRILGKRHDKLESKQACLLLWDIMMAVDLVG